MEYQSVGQNMEFDDLGEENMEEEEEEEENGENGDDIEKGGNMRPSLLFTPSVIRRRSTVYNLPQVK